MANNDILQYLRETPHNTNVNVVKGMIGNESGSGAIEMETVFDGDITFTYEDSEYNYTTATCSLTPNLTLPKEGYIKATLDDRVASGAIRFNFPNNYYFNAYNTSKLFTSDDYFETGINYAPNSMFISITDYTYDSTPDLQAYCQTPHHLKIEWFTI